MLDYIKGQIAELNPTFAVVDNNGLGYMVNISMMTFDVLNRNPEAPVKLYVYEALREDAHILYGFLSKHERELFLLLVSVSGVGPNTARMILSAASVEQIEQSIAAQDVALLKSVKGVGAKTAQRIIVDLKDKIKSTDTTLLVETSQQTGKVYEEAMAALLMLGFSRQASSKALNKLFELNPDITVEQAIKQALKMM